MFRAWLWSWASALPSRTRWQRFCSTCTTSSSARTPPWSRSTLSQRCPPSSAYFSLLVVHPAVKPLDIVSFVEPQWFIAVLVPVQIPVPDPYYTVKIKKMEQHLAIFNARSSIVSQKVGLSLFDFWLWCSILFWIRIQIRFRFLWGKKLLFLRFRFHKTGYKRKLIMRIWVIQSFVREKIYISHIGTVPYWQCCLFGMNRMIKSEFGS